MLRSCALLRLCASLSDNIHMNYFDRKPDCKSTVGCSHGRWRAPASAQVQYAEANGSRWLRWGLTANRFLYITAHTILNVLIFSFCSTAYCFLTGRALRSIGAPLATSNMQHYQLWCDPRCARETVAKSLRPRLYVLLTCSSRGRGDFATGTNAV